MFDSNGNFLTSFGERGSEPGDLEAPNAIAFDSQDNLYVSDNNLNVIQKFDSNGNFLRIFDKSDLGVIDFIHIQTIAFDSQDNLYVSDSFPRILKFDSNGNFLTAFGHNFDALSGCS